MSRPPWWTLKCRWRLVVPHCLGLAPPRTTTAPQSLHWALKGSLEQRSKWAHTALGLAMALKLLECERTRVCDGYETRERGPADVFVALASVEGGGLLSNSPELLSSSEHESSSSGSCLTAFVILFSSSKLGLTLNGDLERAPDIVFPARLNSGTSRLLLPGFNAILFTRFKLRIYLRNICNVYTAKLLEGLAV